MITYEDALSEILHTVTPLTPVSQPLGELLGCVLAEPIVTPWDMPLFDNSAMDGFGVQAQDVASASRETPVSLTVTGTIQAGDAIANLQVEAGTAVKIMTGAPIPAGVEAVVMREYCETQNGHVVVSRAARPGENIRIRGEELKRGATVLETGTLITPSVLGLLATLGLANAWVYQTPTVGLVTSGNELVSPGTPLQAGQIYDSNTYALQGALTAMGLPSPRIDRVRDEADAIQSTLSQALETVDVLVTLGGVSVGDYDLIKGALEALGVETRFWRIALKPGKPVYFGIAQRNGRRRWVFGLPGNPVSALVTFHQLVRPALVKLRGLREASPSFISAQLTHPLRKKPGRLEFVRGVLTHQLEAGADHWKVTPTEGQDSHMMSGLARANALIHFPLDAEYCPEGSWVKTERIQWSVL